MEDKELDDAIATLEAFIDEAEKTCLELEAENADLRSGEYLARVIEERDRYRKALEDVKPDAVKVNAAAWLNDEMGRVAEGQSDAARNIYRIVIAALEATND